MLKNNILATIILVITTIINPPKIKSQTAPKLPFVRWTELKNWKHREAYQVYLGH